jgi:hypothetical protein
VAAVIVAATLLRRTAPHRSQITDTATPHPQLAAEKRKVPDLRA